ncbi:alpha/beta fold hydrolase [Lysinibacillus sp. BPa_S21]|uniref:alpha/beta fold hydrolase n=1 Tax=Lysinibacillus sp. BPa_S21 TaxID=2932478 RepID=UPI0020111DCA|nr:alpha/beta hydrolase [Lysinibacillus sp. BPa_S21]MCL1694503.1 alpha/beta hydrolase [Lysinibacillus sp. BPa_S21]
MQRSIPKIIKFSLIIALFIVLLWVFFPTWTPHIKGEHSISTMEQVEINGAEHEIMIRGVDASNPILIFVHGGPACSEIPYVRKYQKDLEKQFTIVHYDQRGSGKSYHFFEDYSNLTTDLLVEDLLALTDYISEKFNQEKVLLIGHSFGTYIGMRAVAEAPEKYYAYIGIGQVANTVQSELDSLEFIMEQAKLEGNLDDVERLKLLQRSIEQGEEHTPRNLVRKYGGATRLINDNRDYQRGFLLNTEYNGLDVIRYLRGINITQENLLNEEAQHNIPDIVKKVDLPVYFVMGKFDYMTSVNAAKNYFDKLEAPIKEFIIFEESAHYPQFEEKEKFTGWLNKTFNELQNGAFES